MTAPQRGDRAKYAAQVFYRAFNEIDIFVEDTALESKKIYVNLLRRALGGEVEFSQIFPIGDKARVYQRCAADQGERRRPAIYIVDGDHDELLGKALPPLQRLFRLPRYCIENYLFDGAAAVSYLDDEIVDRSRSELEVRLDFQGWFSSIAERLVAHLTAVIATHRMRCGDGIPVANVSLSRLCSSDDGTVEESLVSAIVDQCKRAVDGKHGAGAFDAECVLLNAQLPDMPVQVVLRFVSGKALLLPLLRRRIRNLFGVSKEEALFRLRLSKVCDVSELSAIMRALK